MRCTSWVCMISRFSILTVMLTIGWFLSPSTLLARNDDRCMHDHSIRTLVTTKLSISSNMFFLAILFLTSILLYNWSRRQYLPFGIDVNTECAFQSHLDYDDQLFHHIYLYYCRLHHFSSHHQCCCSSRRHQTSIKSNSRQLMINQSKWWMMNADQWTMLISIGSICSILDCHNIDI